MRDYAEGDFLCEVHWAPCLPFLQLSPVERYPVWTRGRSLGKLRISWWFWLWTKYIQEWQWVKSKRTDQPTVRPVVPLQCALCAYSDGVLVFDYALKSVGHSLVMQVNVSSSLLLPFLLLTTSSLLLHETEISVISSSHQWRWFYLPYVPSHTSSLVLPCISTGWAFRNAFQRIISLDRWEFCFRLYWVPDFWSGFSLVQNTKETKF